MAGISKVEGILASLRPKSPSGFAIGLHIRFTTPDFLFQTYKRDWLTYYSQQGLVMFDPIVRWCFGNTGSIRWSDLGDLDEMGVLDKARSYGMAYGVAMAVERDGSRSVAGFCRPDHDFSDADIDLLMKDLESLHDLTAKSAMPSAEDRENLKRLSVSFTHPMDDSLT